MQNVVTDLSKWPPRRAPAPPPEPAKAPPPSEPELQSASSALRWRGKGR